MRKIFAVLLTLSVSAPLCAGDGRDLVRAAGALIGLGALEHATAPRPEPVPETPIQVIDRSCIKPAVTGNEVTVAIRAVRGAEFYPVRDTLILALQKAGYTVLSPSNTSRSQRNFGSGGNLSDFLRGVYGSGPGFEGGSPESAVGNVPVADYYLEETTTWVSGANSFHGLNSYGRGYYGGYSRGETEGELRISIAMFDGEGRAVPGKVSEAAVHLSLRSSWNGVLIAYSFAGMSGSFRSLADPATEATVRIIPHMFAGGAR